MWTTVLLMAQVALALIGIHMLARRVMPAIHTFSQPGLVLDVWGPLALVLPMLAFVARMNHNVAGPGWMIIGGPIVCAMLAIGMAMMTRAAMLDQDLPIIRDPLESRGRIAAICASIAAMLLLLGAAHDLTVWMGQCAFAIAAILLWINTPETSRERESINPDRDARIGGALAIAVLCAAGQAVAIWMQSGALHMVNAAIAMSTAALILAAAARSGGASACLRLGSWAAAYGVLFGLGLISLSRLLPQAILALRTLQRPQGTPTVKVAYGFGAYAPEAAALLVCAAACLVMDRLRPGMRVGLGIAIILMAAGAMTWRIIDSPDVMALRIPSPNR